MTYVVAATRLYQLRPDGSEAKYKAGDEIDSLSPEDLRRHLASGAVVERVEAEPEPPEDDPDGAGDPDANEGGAGDPDASEGSGDPNADEGGGELKPPLHTALKAEWVKFVVAKTADSDKPVSAEEADALSKADLIALYGGD